jgi:hypothetical protein
MSIFETFRLQDRYSTKLKALKKKMNSAEKLNLKECQKCGFVVGKDLVV